MISKTLKIFGLQYWISNFVLDHWNNFFLTVGQNNFGNKIPKDFVHLYAIFHNIRYFSHRQQQRENLRQFKLNGLLVTLAFFHCVTTLPGNVSFVMWTIFPEVYSKFDGRYLTAVIFETGAMPTPTKSQNPTICGWGDWFHS